MPIQPILTIIRLKWKSQINP